MSRVLRLRRGSTAETAAFTGKLAEVTVDTDTFSLIVHDNVTPGGHRIATEAYVENNKAVTSSGDTAPVDATAGSMWFDTNSGRLYVYYDGAWVDASPTVPAGTSANIGNLQVNDTTITTSTVNSNINIDPNGSGNVNVIGNLHVESRYLELGTNDEFIVKHVDAGIDGNPYNRIRLTTADTGNANIAISISATTTSQMFFNPESGNIGINTRSPNKTLQVVGNIGATGYTANVGLNSGFNFNIGNAYATGLFHVTEESVNKLQLQHDGQVGIILFDNGDMFLPGRKLQINQSPYFTPQNSKLIYADDSETFVQFAMQNRNSGSGASTDVSLFADNGDDSHNFVDMGITSSTYGDPAFTLYGSNDAYLLSAADSGTKLIINTYNDSDVVIATGGVMAENIMTRFKNGVGILPGATNDTYDLGATDNRWKNIHAGNIYIGADKLITGNTAPSSTAPVSPNEGQLWFDLDTGHLFVRVGSVWVDTSLGSNIVGVPTHSTGQSGDVPGLVAYNADYAYYCAGTYDGSSNIWKRVAWSMDTW